ncbi:hypothetical protein BaRGS_00020641 [Batillaria attramentaria]|uniref:Uncharacterized protein n=1 Tax=Batillaria attramentaria TaxID=370345 RepID=A0ABD0KMG7_9CAEN
MMKADRDKFFKVGMEMGSLEGASRVLDLRQRTEHNTVALAEHLPLGGQLVVLGTDPDLNDVKKKYHKASPHGAKVQIRLGRTTHVMHEMMDRGEQFNVMLLDAGNAECTTHLRIAFESGLLDTHGTIVLENAFQGGADYQPYDHPHATWLLGEYIANEPTLHKV